MNGPTVPFGFSPFGAMEDTDDLADYSLFGIVRDNERVILWLLEIDAETDSTRKAGFSTSAGAPFGTVPPGGTIEQTVVTLSMNTLRYANIGLILSDLETHVSGRLAPINVRSEVLTNEQGTFRALGRTTVGEIRLNNQDGSLDNLEQQFLFAGRTLRVYRRNFTPSRLDDLPDITKESFELVYTGMVEFLETGLQETRVRVRDIMSRLDDPIVRERYADFTGVEDEIGSLFKPFVLGRCFNVPLVRRDPVRLIFEAQPGEIRSILKVRDKGIELEFARDYDTREELENLKTEVIGDNDEEEFDLKLGQYATSLAEGAVILGGLPEGIVTADVEGDGGLSTFQEPWSDDTLWSDGTGWTDRDADKLYVSDALGIALRILQEFVDNNISNIVDEESWNNAREGDERVAGFYVAPDREYITSEILDVLVGSVNHLVMNDRTGRIRVRKFRAPGNGYDFILNDSCIRDLQQIRLPYEFPFAVWRGFYEVNNRVLTDTDLASGISDRGRTLLSLPAKTVDAVDPVLRQIFFDKGPAILNSALVSRGATLSTLEQRLDDYSRGRRMFKMIVYGLAFKIRLLDVVRVVYDRFGLSGGQNFLVVGVGEEGLGRRTEITVWG